MATWRSSARSFFEFVDPLVAFSLLSRASSEKTSEVFHLNRIWQGLQFPMDVADHAEIRGGSGCLVRIVIA